METINELEGLRRIVKDINRTSGNMLYPAFGMTLSLSQWAAYSSIKRATIANRIRMGWSVARAVSESATVGNNQYLKY